MNISREAISATSFFFKSELQQSLDFIHGLPGLCSWTLSSQAGLPGHFPEFPWTLSGLSTESLDFVHGLPGHCPVPLDSLDFVWSVHWVPWTLSSPHGLPGHFPEFPWTLSGLSTESLDSQDIVYGHCSVLLDSLDIFQSFPGHCLVCPLNPWTLSVDSRTLFTWTPWTFSRVSLDFVHGLPGHCSVPLDSLDIFQSFPGHCPDCPLSPWKQSRESLSLSTDGNYASLIHNVSIMYFEEQFKNCYI